MITLVREWLMGGKNKPQPQVRPQSNTRLYDGRWVTIVQWYDDGTVDIVHEDDRLNVRIRVLPDWLK
jgi:hypothetical protein